jgi:hypothetical protein
MTQVKTLGELTLEVAQSKIGEKEATGKNDGAFVEAVQDFVDGESDFMRGQPWCAAFFSWCVYRAANRLAHTPRMPKFGSSTAIFVWLSKNSLVLPAPKVGSVGLVREKRKDSKKTHNHTFVVKAVEGDSVVSIDGNVKNQVSETKHKISDCDFGEIA